MAYRYPTIKGEIGETYFFESEGPKGNIIQVISFTPFFVYESSEKPEYYILGFGVPNGAFASDNFNVDDKILINNGDIIKILNTVASSISDFLENNPNEVVYFEGSTPKRMQIYLSLIRKHFGFLRSRFELFGVFDSNWEVFSLEEKKNYDGLYFKKKQ
jgi:hypothetical protein